MTVTVLGIAAACWGLLMAVSPLLQIRQMWRRKSSEDVSIAFFAVLLPGFALWIAYGMARSDLAIVVPNTVAILVGLTTISVALLLRRRARADAPNR
ncbi:MAG TPA: SemiSWEET family transporter [Natronosporangium sp.]